MAGPRPDAYRSVAHSTVTVDGKIYAIGGASSPEEPQAVVEVYDPATDAREAREAMPDAAGYFGLDAIDRRIYRVGKLAVGGPSDRLIAYDIDADTWTDLEPLPVSAAYVTATTLDGKLYAVGGATTDGGEGVLLSTVHRYDPVADEWTDVAPLPSPRAFHRAAAAGGKLYIWNAAFGVGQAAEGEQIAFENRCAGHDGGRCIDASSQSIAAFPLNEKDGLLSRSFEEPQGENCPRGGIRVDAGRDIDGDGQLSGDEATPTTFVCHGLYGDRGVDGADGLDGRDGISGTSGSSGCSAAPGGAGSGALFFASGVAALLFSRWRRGSVSR